ncbi:MAG: peptidase M23, partial [Flavobacteriales bacterium CG_4_9_14_3_um_filter_32_8]
MHRLNNKILSFFFLLVLLINVLPINAQTKKELEQKKQKLQNEISLTNKLLNETRKNKDLTIDELLKLKSKISSRTDLIAAINSEMKLINKEIKKSNEEIGNLENEISRLKVEYAKIIYYAFKHRSSYDKMMFVFASKNVNQAYKRLKYIQQYSEYRKAQAEEIIKNQASLKLKIEELKHTNQEKTVLVSIEEKEKQNLAIEKAQQETIVQQLQGKEQELKSELQKKQEAAQKLDKAIQR